MPSDIHVSRIIRTPKATVSIRGELDEVDKLYREAAKAFLAVGYSIPKPSDNPWGEYGPPPVDDSDHLRRRLNDVENQLAMSQSQSVLQTLRAQLRDMTLDRDTWKDAFVSADNAILAAQRILVTDTPIEIRQALAIEILSL